jgi:hypothetical protein
MIDERVIIECDIACSKLEIQGNSRVRFGPALIARDDNAKEGGRWFDGAILDPQNMLKAATRTAVQEGELGTPPSRDFWILPLTHCYRVLYRLPGISENSCKEKNA